MSEADLHLDGNAVAGQLAEVFSVEMTTAIGTCAHCGTSRPLGMARAYMGGPATVLRCSVCQQVVIRIGTIGGRLLVDTGGVRQLELPGA
jgi:hypothetical protein